MRLGLGAIVSLSALVSVSTADAAQRYAAPAGAGAACSQAAPCALTEAVKKAGGGDEVIVTSGTYAVTETLFPEGDDVSIHGDFGAPMPTIKGAVAGALINATLKSDIAYVEVDNLGDFAGGILCVNNGSIDRVRAKVSGTQSVAISALANCVVRDSLALADGTESVAYIGAGFEDGFTGIARNLTAIATGPESVGVRAEYGPAPKGTYTLDLKNTIAEGGAADLHAAEKAEGNGNIVVSFSNFDRPKQDPAAKLTDAGGNQATAPLFANAAAGDYREAPGSPTIDAGIADQLGALELLGGARVVGSAPDIGAFEFVPVLAASTGQIQSLAVAPRAFRAGGRGGAIASAKKGAKPPIGASVSYSLSASAQVQFTVERIVKGRRVGRKCKTQTAANKSHGKCALHKPIKGGFTQAGNAGSNRFRFSGRIGSKALVPGRYQLTGRAGGVARSATFRIVK